MIESLVGETELQAIRVVHTYTRANSMRTFVDVQEMTNTMPCSMPANPKLVYEDKSATLLLPEVYEKWIPLAEAGELSINQNST